MSTALVINHADQVEAMHNTGAIWSLRLDDCSAEQRIWLLEHHGRVVRLLRKRGHRVRANVVNDPIDGECITARIVSDQWRVPEPCAST